MPIPRRTPPRRLGEAMRRKLEVTSAMAWEALVETHVEQASLFIDLLADHWPIEEALPRYLVEMDLEATMASAIRTRVLVETEDAGSEAPPPGSAGSADPGREGGIRASAVAPFDDAEADDAESDASSWTLLAQPRRVVRGVLKRQRRNEEIDRIVQLTLARAEERVIRTHVENAISFVALLEEQFPLDRCVQQYLGAVNLHGSRAQAVFQRTMARLADVHL
jgi:hypothetical protein